MTAPFAAFFDRRIRSFEKRLSLWSLFAAVLLPGIMALGLTTYFQYIEIRKGIESEILQMARAMSKTVDLELKHAQSNLQALAASSLVQNRNWPQLYQELKHFDEVQDFPHHIALTDASGQQILNTLKPYGVPLGKSQNIERLQPVFTTGQAGISDLVKGSTSGRWVILIDVPVNMNGQRSHVLTSVIDTQRLQQILISQGMPTHWLGAIVDRQGVTVARTRSSERFVGQPTVPQLHDAILRMPQGRLDTETLDGVRTLTVFSRSAETGFTVVLGVPFDAIHERLLADLKRSVIVIAIMMVLTLLMVIWVGRRILEPIQAITEVAKAAESGALDARLDTGGTDEIERMAEQFNRMLSARQEAEAELRIAAIAFESNEGMMVTDAKGIILRVNKAFTAITGYTPEEIIGKTPRVLQSGEHDAAFYKAMWRLIHETGSWQGEIWDRHKSGRIYPKWLTISSVYDDQGAVTHYVAAQYDITERKQYEEKINALAFYDQLTGLANRTLLFDRLTRCMSHSARQRRYGALMFIDLDNFKVLNDTQGHELGDQLLKQVALRLKECLRPDDVVARQGGDEFVVVLADVGSDEKQAAEAAANAAQQILARLNEPYLLGELTHRNSSSIGVTLFQGHLPAADELMKQADMAMYKSKANGRNTVCLYDPSLETKVKARAQLERDMHVALETGQFFLHYQPQVSGSGQVIGAEVLIRWHHPQRGMVSPADFIPVAEETDLIVAIGEWVLRSACQRLAHWASQPELAQLTIAVNVSANQFRSSYFPDQVLSMLRQTGAPPQRLKLELTESMLVQDVERIIASMRQLKTHGIGFSLDDFGTGYSSLSYLKRLPLDQLKIDQSFVRDVLTDVNDASIARTIVALGQTLGLSVIAEGVETEAQRDFLARNGCLAYQGYLFSRPVCVEDFEQQIRSIHTSTTNC